MLRSWREGVPVTTPTAGTKADGIAVRVPVPAAVAGMAGTVDRMVAVSDATAAVILTGSNVEEDAAAEVVASSA